MAAGEAEDEPGDQTLPMNRHDSLSPCGVALTLLLICGWPHETPAWGKDRPEPTIAFLDEVEAAPDGDTQEGPIFADPRGETTDPPGPAPQTLEALPSPDDPLDKAAEKLAQIPLDKVFTEGTLLKRVNRQVIAPIPGDRDPYRGRDEVLEFHWVASNLAHRTLYFDDEPLERFGYSRSPLLQPLLSTCEFAKDVVASPIRGIFDSPNECHFVAGRARVGSSVCAFKERLVPHR